jgi:ribosome-interacting GTPase 1
MPANLTPEYKEAEERFRGAATPEEKLACLREMLRVIPKHKGTEKLQADLKRRISKLQQGEKKSATRRHPGEFVDREGSKQVLIIGGANTGKSSLLAALTGAHPEIAPYPFTTTHLAPGMMPFEDVQIQIVDGPATCRSFVQPWLGNQIKSCDLVLWTVSLGDDDLLAAIAELREQLDHWRIELRPATAGGAAIGGAATGGAARAGPDRPTAPEEPNDADGSGTGVKPALLVGTHADDAAAGAREALLLEGLGEGWSLHRVATPGHRGIEDLKRAIFASLRIVRVYTKAPGKKPDVGAPYVLDAGSTVLTLAARIHRDLAERLRFARIWGKGAFDGQHVQRDHILSDGDIVELHT